MADPHTPDSPTVADEQAHSEAFDEDKALDPVHEREPDYDKNDPENAAPVDEAMDGARGVRFDESVPVDAGEDIDAEEEEEEEDGGPRDREGDDEDDPIRRRRIASEEAVKDELPMPGPDSRRQAAQPGPRGAEDIKPGRP